MTVAPPRPPPLTIGDPAPDLTLLDAAGTPVRLADLWATAPRGLALLFLRHFG